ncbi:hypothetical protein R3P38DRAFT_3287614 [Favolaschia claudopus]|uniref:Uncharacterized protein n=1 Tax=Favolaschia claudopus TaxID=2862362 RepID=A0AAW0A0B1_9AGAR
MKSEYNTPSVLQAVGRSTEEVTALTSPGASRRYLVDNWQMLGVTNDASDYQTRHERSSSGRVWDYPLYAKITSRSFSSGCHPRATILRRIRSTLNIGTSGVLSVEALGRLWATPNERDTPPPPPNQASVTIPRFVSTKRQWLILNQSPSALLMRTRSGCTYHSAPSLSSLSVPGDRLSRHGSGTLPMSACWPDWMYISTCSLTRGAEGFLLQHRFASALHARRCWSNNDVLPRTDIVAASSRYVNPSPPLQSLGSTYLRLFRCTLPPLLRPSRPTPINPSAALGSTRCCRYPHPPGVPPLPPYVVPHLDLRPAPPRPHQPRLIFLYPACPHLHPYLRLRLLRLHLIPTHLHFTSASPWSSALDLLPPPRRLRIPPRTCVFSCPPSCALSPLLGHLCIQTTLGKWCLWAGD